MIAVKEAAAGFLANKRIAVTGVSRDPATHGANAVYRRLRDRGCTVFALNPNADDLPPPASRLPPPAAAHRPASDI